MCQAILFLFRNGCNSLLPGSRQKHTLPELPYEYKALEPVISCDIMHLHHSKHHATYVANLNIAEEKLKEAESKSKPTICHKFLCYIS